MSLTGKSKLAGVFGWPVAHSRSPRLHGRWIERHGLDAAYVPLVCRPEHFETALRALGDVGFVGVNITLPHKEAALVCVDRLDPAANRIGAVNTVTYGKSGEITGNNTDSFGFLENIGQQAPDFSIEYGPSVVLGAGGGARAVLVALIDAGAPEIRLTNRTDARAEALVDAVKHDISVVSWANRADALDGANLVVNATSLGMTGQPALDIDLAPLGASALVTDLVYAPLKTPLLRAARAKGCRTVDGLGMLLHQARPGFRDWFGIDPEVDDGLRRFVAADLIDG